MVAVVELPSRNQFATTAFDNAAAAFKVLILNATKIDPLCRGWLKELQKIDLPNMIKEYGHEHILKLDSKHLWIICGQLKGYHENKKTLLHSNLFLPWIRF
jgi:hypothetical protein